MAAIQEYGAFLVCECDAYCVFYLEDHLAEVEN